jgi:energy-coupling factor transporter ATP-binding protein EcfA2
MMQGADLAYEPMENVAEDYGRWMIHGPQGSGKTTLASTIAEAGPTLFIDLTGEKGIRSFRGAPYAGNIKISRPTSVTALDDVFWWLAKGDHPFIAVVVDSLTAVQKMTMRFLLGHDETAVREIRQGTAPADIRTWGQSLDVMQDTSTFWFGLADGNRPKPMHVVMTAQTKLSENEETGSIQRTPDVQKGALSITLAAPDYILYTDEEDNPDAVADDTLPPTLHIVRFGSHPGYKTKARVPFYLRGKIPPILGRTKPPSLVDLSRVLRIGGIPARPATTTPKAAPTKGSDG